MLQVYGGQNHIIMKGRGAKAMHKEWDRILKEMAEGPKPVRIGISHVEGDKEVDRLKAAVEELYPNIPVVVRETVPIIATHTGMGACCLLYYTE